MNVESIILTSTVENDLVGRSLIDYLCQRFPYKTKDGWVDSITTGKVVVNDETTIPDRFLNLKDRVSYTSERSEPPVATNIETLFEDDFLWVVNKPAPLPVHSNGFFILNTLIHILRQRTGNEDLRLAHRLDRETTGVLVLAKNKNVAAKLVNEFEENRVEKQYLAVTHRVDFEERLIHGWMGPKHESLIPKRQQLVEQKIDGYKESSTRFTLQKQFKNHSLLSCEMLSGRTNQIRVHLEAAGFPVVGDKMYGRPDEDYMRYVQDYKDTRNLHIDGDWEHPRQLLHAWRLTLNHPVTGERMQWEAPMPQDMSEFVRKSS